MKLATRVTTTLLLSASVLSAQQPPTPPPTPPRPAPAAPLPALAPLAPLALNWDTPIPDRFAIDDIMQQVDVQVAMAGQYANDASRMLELSGWLAPEAERTPPAPWAQGDPADSLYRVARQSFNDGDWRRAADLFNQIPQKYPHSVYVTDCAYWQAYALYHIGTTDDLHAAYRVLADQPKRDSTTRMASTVSSSRRSGSYANGGRMNSQTDVAALTARILGALAARGDQQAAAQIAQSAQQKGSCDREDVSVRAEALSALGQMDPAAATPLIRRVLESKDQCVELKRQAMLLLVRRSDSTAATTLMAVAKNNDEDLSLRADAVSYLGRLPGDNTVATLEDILKSSTEESMQRAALNALGSNDSPRAHQALRTLIERNDASERLRIDAINSLVGNAGYRVLDVRNGGMNYVPVQYGVVTPAAAPSGGRGGVVVSAGATPVVAPMPAVGGVGIGQGMGGGRGGRAGSYTNASRGTPEDAAFLRDLYPKLQSEQLKRAVLDALARIGGADNQQFLLGVVRNNSESSDVRAAAASRVSRMDISIGDLTKLYDAAESRALREQLINALAQRSEPEAVDKLGDIAKNSTDSDSRRYALNALSRKRDDPRVAKILSEIINK